MRSEHVAEFDASRLPREAAARWTDASTIEPVQQSETFVYRIAGGPSGGFLRLSHDGHRPREQIEAELAFVRHLAGAGVRVAVPRRSRGGSWVETLATPSTTFHACLFEAAPGEPFAFRSVPDDAATIRRWGALTGAIHAASTRHSPRGPRRIRWDADDAWANAEAYFPAGETSARRELATVRVLLADRPEDESTFGLIHGDLCAANFRVGDAGVVAFDFDDCVDHWFVFDLAFRDAFVDGSRDAMPLPDGWAASFDAFLRLRGLHLFVLNLRDGPRDLAAHPKRGFLDVLRRTFDDPPRW